MKSCMEISQTARMPMMPVSGESMMTRCSFAVGYGENSSLPRSQGQRIIVPVMAAGSNWLTKRGEFGAAREARTGLTTLDAQDLQSENGIRVTARSVASACSCRVSR